MTKFSRRARLVTLLLIGWGWEMSSARAVNYYWDGGNIDLSGAVDGASQGGAGTWNTVLTNWDSGAYVAWPTTGTANDAIFGGTAGTITVTEPITVHNLTFTTSGYTLSGAGTLTTNGATPTIIADTGISATINVPITGTLGFTKNGMGTLNLGGVNTHTGITSIAFGTVNLSGDQSAANGGWNISSTDNTAGFTRTVNFLAASTVAVAAGKVFQVGATSASGQASTLNVAGTVNNAGTLNVQRNATLNLLGGGIWNQSGALRISAPGGSGSGSALSVAANSTFNYTGSSLIEMNSAAAGAGAATLTISGLFSTGMGFTNLTPLPLPTLPTVAGNTGITLNGGTLQLTADVPVLTNASAYPFFFVIGASGGTIDTKEFNVTMTRPFSGSGILSKTGTGTLNLAAASTHTGATSIAGGTLKLAGGTNTLVSTAPINFSGTSTLSLDGISQTVSNLTFANASNTTITGSAGSALTVSPALLELAPTNSATTSTTINMGGLTAFTYNNPTGTINVGAKIAAGTGTAASGTVAVTLATAGSALTNANTITAATISIGPYGVGDSSGGNPTILNLGLNNTFNVTTLNVGNAGSRASGTLKFAAGLTNPTLSIAGVTGGASTTNLNVGSHDNFLSNNVYNALLDTTGGTLNAQFGTIVIGRQLSSSTGTRSSRNTSTFKMGAGTMTANAMTLGIINANGGTSTYTFVTSSLFSIESGGTANIGNITLGTSNYITGLTGTNTFNSQLSLLNGTLNATTITQGTVATPSAGTLTATAQINWTTGTIGNLAGTNLTISSLPILLTTAGDHTFNISGTNTGTVASTSVISGDSSGITKAGTGALFLDAANTYGGGTTVSAGALYANNTAGSATGTAAVMVGANGTLGGSGIIAGATTVTGTLAPGNSIDSLTINNTLALAGTAAFEINDTLATADLVDGVTTLTFGGTLLVTNLGSGTDFVAGQTFNLFDFASASGTFAAISLPTLPGGLQWQVYGTQTFDYTTGQISVVVAAIPEPSTLVLAGVGLLGFAGLRFRQRRLPA